MLSKNEGRRCVALRARSIESAAPCLRHIQHGHGVLNPQLPRPAARTKIKVFKICCSQHFYMLALVDGIEWSETEVYIIIVIQPLTLVTFEFHTSNFELAPIARCSRLTET